MSRFSLGSMGVAALAVTRFGCADLAAIEPDVCGNRVVEAALGEHCDGTAYCGAPATINACRFECDEAGAGCPSGWSCGVDRACRQPSGTFAAGAAIAAIGEQTSLADVDADGLVDVLVQNASSLAIHYGDRDEPLRATSQVNLPPTSRPVAVLGGPPGAPRDLVSDLDPFGLVLFANDGARGFSSVPQQLASLQSGGACLTIDGAAVRGGVDDGARMLLVESSAPGQVDNTVTIGFLAQADGCQADCAVHQGVGSVLRRHVAVGPLGYDAATLNVSPDEFFAVPIVEATQLGIWGVKLAALPALAWPKRVGTLPLGAPLGDDGHVALGDADFDGCPDVVVDLGTTARALQVFPGRTAPAAPCAGPGVPMTIDYPSSATLLGPVRFGEVVLWAWSRPAVNGYDVGLVAPGYVQQLDTGLPQPVSAVLRTPGRPTLVTSLDFNHDDFPDLVVATDDGIVDFYLNYEFAAFNAFRAATGILPSAHAVGDFDGDLFDDLALVVPSTSDPGRDELVFLYGAAAGGPSEPVWTGRFPAEAAVVTVDNAIDSALVVSSTQVDGAGVCTTPVSLLFGNTARQSAAPFAVTYGSVGAGLGDSVVPSRIFLDASGEEPAPRLVTLGRHGGVGPVVLSQLTVADQAFAVQSAVHYPQSPGAPVIDLDRGRAVSAQLEPATPGAELVAVVRSNPKDDRTDPLPELWVELDPGAASPTPRVTELPAALAGLRALRLVDVDADAVVDAVGLSGERTIWSALNVGASVEIGQPRVTDLPSTVTCGSLAAFRGQVGADAALVLGCVDRGADLAAATPRLVFATLEAGTGEVRADRSLPWPSPIAALEIGDVDGDGLDDVVVRSASALTVLRQCPADELSCLSPLPWP